MERLTTIRRPRLAFVSLLVMAMPILVIALTQTFSFEEPEPMTLIDWVICASFIASGLTLYFRVKVAWLVAMMQMFLLATLNLIRLGTLVAQGHGGFAATYQLLFSLALLSAILLIAAYFHFPYLDRRDTILMGIARRYRVALDATLNDDYSAQVVSVSITGVALRLTSGALKINPKHVYNLAIPQLKIADQAVLVVGVEEEATGSRLVRLKFDSMPMGEMLRLKHLLKAYPDEDRAVAPA